MAEIIIGAILLFLAAVAALLSIFIWRGEDCFPKVCVKNVRLNILVSHETLATLEVIAKKQDSTTSEVFKKAVVLYDFAADSKERGFRIGSIDAEGNMITEVVNI